MIGRESQTSVIQLELRPQASREPHVSMGWRYLCHSAEYENEQLLNTKSAIKLSAFKKGYSSYYGKNKIYFPTGRKFECVSIILTFILKTVF